MSLRKRGRYGTATGLPKVGAGVRSVAISVAAGGEAKSLMPTVKRLPTWQL